MNAVSIAGPSIVLAALAFIWMRPRTFAARLGSLLLSSLGLLLVCSEPTIRLQAQLVNSMPRYQTQPLPSQLVDLIKAEHQKAIGEIRMNQQEEDEWYHKKFLLVGGLFSAFLIVVGVGAKASVSGQGEEQLERLATSRVTVSALALATVVALAIDMHVRRNIVVVQQLGLWIRHCVEAILSPPIASNPVATAGGFLGWESFLRIQQPDAGMHSDALYNFFFYPHLHFLTWVLYILYVSSLQTTFLTPEAATAERRIRQKRLSTFGFVLVHVSILAFAWSAHLYPRAIELRPFPMGETWLDGWAGAGVFCIPAVCAAIAACPYLRSGDRAKRA
jgi:hypothetical protein